MPEVDVTGEISRIRKRFLADPHGFRAERALSDLADRAIVERWPEASEDWAALAVGGFGRRMLHPASDLDILFFSARRRRDRTWVERMLAALDDIPFASEADPAIESDLAEFEPSRAFIYGAFLDARFLAGERSLAASFTDRIIPDFLGRHGSALIQSLVATRNERLPQSDSAGEPDLKNSPGGLSDYRWIRWVHRIGVSVSGGSSAVVEDLEGAVRCLAALRNALHFAAPDGGNALSRELQPRVAEMLGYRDGPRPDTRRVLQDWARASGVIREQAEVLAADWS